MSVYEYTDTHTDVCYLWWITDIISNNELGEKQRAGATAEPDMIQKVNLAWAHSKKMRWQQCQARLQSMPHGHRGRRKKCDGKQNTSTAGGDTRYGDEHSNGICFTKRNTAKVRVSQVKNWWLNYRKTTSAAPKDWGIRGAKGGNATSSEIFFKCRQYG